MTREPNRRAVLQLIGGLVAVTGCSRLASSPQARADQSAPMRYAYGPHPSQYAELSLPDGTGQDRRIALSAAAPS